MSLLILCNVYLFVYSYLYSFVSFISKDIPVCVTLIFETDTLLREL